VPDFSRLFSAYDRGAISRRDLLQALGVAMAAVPFSGAAFSRVFAQGQCAGRDRDTSAACVKTPMQMPFMPTGWKTVLLDHFSMKVTDAEREAAFYSAFMNWKVRSNDANGIYMDIGDWGGAIIKGGYTPPPRTNPGGGGGGAGAPVLTQAQASKLPPCTPPRANIAVQGGGAVWDGFCWGITPWDTKKVEAALKERGLNPVADHKGDDFRSFHVKDPDGLDVQISNGNRSNRRKTPATAKLNVELPFEPTPWKTVYLDHISFSVTSYKETVAFYEALLGWKGLGDEGSQNNTEISPEIGGLLIRGGNAFSPSFQMPAQRRAVMNHVSFGITPFDPDAVWAELCKRGLTGRVDTGAIATSPDVEKDIHTARYKSYHTRTPNNYDLQFSSKISAGRGESGGD
jgi:catechol 2,3-dioxygenase-like lactoylglutathione lyase family enzyme